MELDSRHKSTKAVVLPGNAQTGQTAGDGSSEPTSSASPVHESMLQEVKILEQGKLYAAMTRARNRLYLIADDEPNEDLLNARSKFDWQDRTSG